MIEYGGWFTWRRRQILLHRRIDALLALGSERFFLLLSPRALVHQIGAQTRNRLRLPARLDVLGAAIARGIIRRGVVAQAVGHRLDQGRAAAIARTRDCFAGRGMDRNDVIAVDLLAGEPG